MSRVRPADDTPSQEALMQQSPDRASDRCTPATFVLVHGGLARRLVLEAVAPLLRAAGHARSSPRR